MRPKIAPQRGQVAAFADIMARHAGHEVILAIVLPRSASALSLLVRLLGQRRDCGQ